MKLALQKVSPTPLFFLALVSLFLLNGCDTSQKLTGSPTLYNCSSVMMTAYELNYLYSNPAFTKLSLTINTTTNGEIYPQFYGVAADGSTMNFRNVSVLDGTQRIWLNPVIASQYDIIKDDRDQVKALLAIPNVDHFVFQPWSFDDPNYVSDPNLLEYYIMAYDAYGHEIDLIRTLSSTPANRIERLIRIDPIPPGTRY